MKLSPSEKYLVQMLQEQGTLGKSEAEIEHLVNIVIRKHGSWLEKQEFFDAGYNADKWISVKDRLPTEENGVFGVEDVGEKGKPELWKYTKIIAYFPAGIFNGKIYEKAEVRETKFFLHRDRLKYSVKFTHWQPLPPPPKEAKEMCNSTLEEKEIAVIFKPCIGQLKAHEDLKGWYNPKTKKFRISNYYYEWKEEDVLEWCKRGLND